MKSTRDVLVVGAGLAGLSCASELDRNGVGARLLEKSRGVGGRCATRRIEGKPVDHGLAFYHGDDRSFLDALHAVGPGAALDWPRRIVGEGAPCQPRAFRAEQERLAFADGVATFPKQLAQGLSIDLETRVTSLEAAGERMTLVTDSGRRHTAREVVLALPAAQAVTLLQTLALPTSRELAAATRLLAGISMVRCLTLIAGYPAGTRFPEWDVCYPEESATLQMVTQDSRKRIAAPQPILVLQSRPGWAVQHWDDEPKDWSEGILAAARPLCGDAVTQPAWTDTQRWRYARLTGGETLTEPLVVPLENGCRIGIAGEATAAGGGAQAAWLSGRRMAERLLQETTR